MLVACEDKTDLHVSIGVDEKRALVDDYFADIDNFLNNEFDPNNSKSMELIQDRVIEPCSKLTMLLSDEKLANQFLRKKNMDEYDFRASFCLSAAINQKEPQPQFEDTEMVIEICKSDKFFDHVCERFGVRESL